MHIWGFLHTAVGQILRKLNEDETQQKLRDQQRVGELWSFSNQVSEIEWTSDPSPGFLTVTFKLILTSGSHRMQPHSADGTDTFILMKTQKIMIDARVTTHKYSEVDIGKFITVMRKKHYWQDRDKSLVFTYSRVHYWQTLGPPITHWVSLCVWGGFVILPLLATKVRAFHARKSYIDDHFLMTTTCLLFAPMTSSAFQENKSIGWLKEQ